MKTELTPDQKKAYDIIMSGSDAFITGGGGTGKSFLIQKIVNDLQVFGKNYIVCAPTGTASLNIGGITIHKAFGFDAGPCITDKLHKIIIRTPKLLCMADIIIIDEISMCRMDMMDAIFLSIKKARQKTQRKIQLIVFGDFFQLPPVINEIGRERDLLEMHYKRPIGNGYAFQADGWRNFGFTVVVLSDVVRQKDADFIQNLNLIRIGNTTAIEYFNNNALHTENKEGVWVYAYNNSVNRLNMRELQKLPGMLITFNPLYYGSNITDIELPESLSLKQGAKVIITTNSDSCLYEDFNSTLGPFLKHNRGTFHNGSTGIVVEAFRDQDNPKNDYVIVQLSSGQIHTFYRKAQPIYDFISDEQGHVQRKVVGFISQIPLKLGYGITIHKSQGQTYESMNLDPTCWSSGQLYVALSRLTTIKGLHITHNIAFNDLHVDPLVKEFYKHIYDSNYTPSWECDSINKTSADKKASQTVSRANDNSNTSDKKDTIALTQKQQHNDFDEKSCPPSPTCNCDSEKTVKKSPVQSRKSIGRPTRYPNGSHVVRIPSELSAEFEWLMNYICPKGGINTEALESFKKMIKEYYNMSIS